MSGDKAIILVLDDQPMISLELEQLISDARLGQAVAMTSCGPACEWLQANTPEAAVLDIGLHGGDSRAVAEILVERGIPFVVHTGRERDSLSLSTYRIYERGIWVAKPSAPDELVAAISRALAAARQREPN